MGKRVAVIGAGASGLPALKECKEAGLDPVCFERTGHIGGLWRFREEVKNGQGSVMKSTVANTSKEMMCYSDFPIPESFPNFMHNTKVYEYLTLYANYFDLFQHIQLHTNVLKVRQELEQTECGVEAHTGRWCLDLEDLQTGKKWSDVFDCVMLCTGHYAERNMPDFDGISDFKGTVMHTHEYRDPSCFVDKNVVIIGVGNSALDMAVEISRSAKQVWVSTRRGAWVLNRVYDNGIPVDLVGLRRSVVTVQNLLPASWLDHILRSILNKRFNHALYSLRPAHRVKGAQPAINDDLPNRLACGSIIIKTDIQRVMPTGVRFIDRTVVEDVDAIVLGTGYQFGFPFLEEGIIDVKNNEVSLYQMVFPPTLKHPTLAVIGCIQPLAAIFPVSEIQCRWVTQVFKGERSLPGQREMQQEIKRRHDVRKKQYVTSPRHTIQVNYIEYIDQMADNIGCRPQLGKLLLSDPRLAMKCIFGPAVPSQWRIHGPGAWPGAKRTIETVWQRMEYPLRTRQVPSHEDRHPLISFCRVITIIVCAVFFMCFCMLAFGQLQDTGSQSYFMLVLSRE